MNQDKSVFLRHVSCNQCGSSDAKALYSGGTSYCFSCGTWGVEDEASKGFERRRTTIADGLLQNLEYTSLSVRKISEDTCKKFGYGIGKYRGQPVQVAPYYKNGALVAQHLRTGDKKFPWLGDSKHLDLFGKQLWQSHGKRLVITEGEIDCMTVAQIFNLRWATVSVPNGAQSAVKYIKQNLEWIESFNEVVFAFDSDEPGEEAASECASLLTPGKAKIAVWTPFKDANEMLQQGKGGKIAEVIFQARQYRPDGIIAGSDISLESLLADDANMFSFDLPYPKLNSTLKGLRKGEITTLTAGTGIGKSTFAREIGYHLVTSHNLKVGIVALEESIKKSAIGMIALKLNVPMGDLYIDKSLVPREDFEEAYDSLIASDKFYFYDHFGSLDSDNLVAKLRFLTQGLGVDFIILDHLSIVVSGIEDGDERRIIDNLMTSLRSLVENTGVGMVVISHLKVPQNGKAHEEGGRVDLNQLRGSGSIKQLSDNIIGIERDQQGDDPDVSNIRLLKNRLFGITGLADSLKYNHETGRLLLFDEEQEIIDGFMNDNEEKEEYCDVPF